MDVERLSTKREEERQTREAGFTLEVGQSGRAFGCAHTQYEVLQDLNTP